ncbi:ATP-dependent RNA helicase DDX42-like isoform X2 [Corticium candelabrum]|nr:ATP-dependent RNA helicase DDX42-like isoform X2 [Corticium candelabrum]
MVPYADDEEAEDVEYDMDGNPIYRRPRIIEPLSPIDHSEIDYQEFEKCFYAEHEEITALSIHQMLDIRKKLSIKVNGADPKKPCISFAHFGFDDNLMKAIRKSEFTTPTPIQAQAIPIALSGRDVIGIAKTGSGKTVAYLWPLLVHIMDQPEIKEGDGPIGLICAPTRELCQQIFFEAKKYGKAYGLRACAVYGGGSKWEQTKALKEWPEIVVATPGRLIDHVKSKTTDLKRVTYLVFDEADRMFDMGFEPQVRSIANHVRPDRQTMLFSATFKKKVERLARDALTDPIRVVIGELGEASEDVTQHVHIFATREEKWPWVKKNLVQYLSSGSVLIFVTKKADSETLAASLRSNDFELGLLHGDMDQNSRDEIITKFRRKQLAILVATDVASRGLDIQHIKTVINYDIARDITTHTHRIGRTGRAGEKGVAHTLLTNKDVHFAGDLVRNMEQANQAVPSSLLDLAMQNPRFKKTRFNRGGGGGRRAGIGRGRGGPGLGYSSSASSAGGRARPGFVGFSQGENLSSKSSGTSPVKKATGTSGYVAFSKGDSLSSVAGTKSSDSASSAAPGPMSAGGGRSALLKAAFAAKYSRFQRSSDSTSSQTMSTSGEGAVPPQQPAKPEGKKRRSRWD